MMGVYPSSGIPKFEVSSLPKIKTRSFPDDSYVPMASFRNIHVQTKSLDTFDPVLLCPIVLKNLTEAQNMVNKKLEVKY
jgi:hypothetical protein